MTTEPSIAEFIEHLAVAVLCGTLIGLERQWRQHNAGLHTCTLVTMGSALFVSISLWTERETNAARIAAQVVTGVGFLCAGTIMRSGLTIRGLNTAGTLWCSAAVGALAGLGLIHQALFGTLTVLLVNVVFRPLATLINRHPASGTEGEHHYLLSLSCRSAQQNHLRKLLVQYLQLGDLKLQDLAIADDAQSGQSSLNATLAATERVDDEVEKLANQFAVEASVLTVRWTPLLPGAETDQRSAAAKLFLLDPHG
jgi:putative Mg2+ transporter-C (MgtC) family protein